MCSFHKILIINLYNNNNNLKSCCYKLLHLDDLFFADPHKHGWRERGPINVSWPVFHHFITGVENTLSVSEQQEQRGCQSSVSVCQSSVKCNPGEWCRPPQGSPQNMTRSHVNTYSETMGEIKHLWNQSHSTKTLENTQAVSGHIQHIQLINDASIEKDWSEK